MESSFDIAPRVEELTSDAYRWLQAGKPAKALPKQQEALELLELLGFLENNPSDQGDGHDKGNQEGRKSQDRDENRQQDGDEQRYPNRMVKRQPRDLTRQQAEAVLTRARERVSKRHEVEKALQQYLYRSNRVEQDW